MKFIDNDFVSLRRDPKAKSKIIRKIAFGDAVEVIEEVGNYIKIRALDYAGSFSGYVLRVRTLYSHQMTAATMQSAAM
jgi:uncharacterized protein YgiM (DUF1202 family)